MPVPPMSDLRPYFAIADGLSALFTPFVEAVIHDLASDSVVHVARPLSPREPGDPSELKDLRITPETSVLGPYEKTNWDGRRVKSVSIVLRDEAGAPIGLMCVNADVSAFEATRRMLQDFLCMAPPETGPAFDDDWHERINRFIAGWTARRQTPLERLDRAGRRDLIAALDATGGFEGRRAAAYVARVLGVSRATIYNELAKVRA